MRVGKLGSVNVLLADTEYELYKLTEDNSFSVVTVTGVNRGIAPVKMSIGIKDVDGNVYWLENDVEILQKNVIVRTGVNLSTGDTIICKSNADQCNFVCTGSQSSDALADVAAPSLQSSNTLVESSPTASNFYGTAVTTTTSFYATSAPGAGTVEVNSVDDTPIVSIVNSVTNAIADRYGEAIDISDFYLVVGAPGETGSNSEVSAGKVYIYETFSGSLLHTLVSPNELTDQFFGASVAIDSVNNKLYVGEPGLNTNNVYRYTLSTGAYDNAFSNPGTNGIEFGHSLALSPSGSQLVVGAPNTNTGTGAVYVLDTATMAAGAAIPGTVVLADEGDDYFPLRMGSAVATDGTNIFMGAPTSTRGPDNIGVVQVKNMSGAPVADIVPPLGFEQADMEFGAGITVNSELLVITAPGYDSDNGYAFAYLNDGNLFERVADVAPPDPTVKRFGESVDASDAKILLGAPEATVSDETNAGAVYSYRDDNTQYTSRSVTSAFTTSSATADQGVSVTATFSVDLPYASNAGFDFNWGISGFTDVITTAGVTGAVSSALSGTGTTDSSGEISFTINTKDKTALEFFDQGNQTITLSIDNNSVDFTIIPGAPELYAFSSHTFTSAGVTGRTGPSEAQVQSAYSSASWSPDYIAASNGVQLWTVPADGVYRIQANGATGGRSVNWGRNGGTGASARGDFTLKVGDVLRIGVGQYGGSNTYDGGGGGASFVAVDPDDGSATTLLVIGGGGGGGSASGFNTGSAPSSNNAITDARGANTAYYTGGSTSGTGGSGGTAGGGSGWNGAGSGSWSPTTAISSSSGPIGGDGQADGGFGGGGGGGGTNGAGGGGGYGGGGASQWSYGAGGGGSFVQSAGTYAANSPAKAVNATSGTSNGTVTINKLSG